MLPIPKSGKNVIQTPSPRAHSIKKGRGLGTRLGTRLMHNQIAEDGGICVVHGEDAYVLPLEFLALQQTKGPLNHRERKERPAVILYKVNQSIYVCLRCVQWSML